MNTFEQLQTRAAQFTDNLNWRQFHSPKNLSMALAVEAAELMEIFQWSENEQSIEQMHDPEIQKLVEDEVADILIYVLHFANATNIDLEKIVNKKLTKNEVRFNDAGASLASFKQNILKKRK